MYGRKVSGTGVRISAVRRAFGLLRTKNALLAGACLLGAGSLLLAGCSKESVGKAPDGRVEIIPQAALPASVAAGKMRSRAAADPSQAMDFWFARSDENAAGEWDVYGAAALRATRTGGDGAQALAFDARQYYLANGLKSRMTGWYPGGASAAGSGEGYYDAAAGMVSWTIDGGQDILLAAPRQGSKTAAMPAFEFRHALAQLRFYFYADSEIALTQWGKIRGIAVSGQRASVAFTPATAEDDDLSLAFTGDADGTFAAADFAELTVPVGTKDDAAAGGAPVMIEPQENPCLLTVEITTEKRGVQTAAVSPRVYKAGEAVRICIRLAEEYVMIDPAGCGIEPWGDAVQTEDNEIGVENNLGDDIFGPDSYPGVVKGNFIVVKDAFGHADPEMYPIHEPWTVTPAHNESGWDANVSGYNTVAARFEVALADANSGNRVQWASAGSVCASYSQLSGEAGTWRLPTVRELKLIFDMNLIVPPSSGSNVMYWAATGYTDMFPWVVHISAGPAGGAVPAMAVLYVRCVRDLADGQSGSDNRDTNRE